MPENPPEKKLVEGVDYTIDPETGFFVFTRDYLLRRGYCCESGCRQCPYGFSKKSGGEGPVSS